MNVTFRNFILILKDFKSYLLIAPIVLCQSYYFFEEVSVYEDFSGLFTATTKPLFEKGMVIIVYLMLLTLLMSYYDKYTIFLRYKGIKYWAKDFLYNSICVTVTFFLVINITPFILTLYYKGIDVKQLISFIVHAYIQIGAFIMMNYIYMCIFLIKRNSLFCVFSIAVTIYLPTYILESFKRGYLKPIDLIFYNLNSSTNQTLLQVNTLFLIICFVVYTIKKDLIKNIFKGDKIV